MMYCITGRDKDYIGNNKDKQSEFVIIHLNKTPNLSYENNFVFVSQAQYINKAVAKSIT